MMKISLIQLGKTEDKRIEGLIKDYEKRIKHFSGFEIITLKEARLHKNASKEEYTLKEALELLKYLDRHPFPVLLDENGKHHNSREFTDKLDEWITKHNHISFIIGGAYGFHSSIYDLKLPKVALSKMTFTHQWARPIFTEQLYRAFTIMNKHPYHH